MDPQTLIYFVAHASLLIRCGEAWLLTDPWFDAPAFTTWVPSPPPALNPAMLVGLAATGRLGVVISHAHPDHFDPVFLSRLPPTTPVFVAEFPNDHLTSQLGRYDVQTLGEVEFYDFSLRAFEHLDSSYDAAISIETPDSFVFHGNDSWALGEQARRRLREVKPAGKASLFAGQGASASGHPLTYRSIGDPGGVLRTKNDRMLRSLHDTALDLDFDRVLAYACFTRINYRDYAFRAPTVHGSYANKVTGSDRFIDLSPGDVYLPATDQTINITDSLHVDQRGFPHLAVEADFPSVGHDVWISYKEAFADFVRGAPCDRVRLVIEVVSDGEQVDRAEHGIGPRTKTCVVEAAVMAAVLDKRIPFEDLYTGYLAEWDRDPPDVYNRRFLLDLIDYGYRYAGS